VKILIGELLKGINVYDFPRNKVLTRIYLSLDKNLEISF
jgi:hypothetical protein